MGYTGEKTLRIYEGHINQVCEMQKVLNDKNGERIEA